MRTYTDLQSLVAEDDQDSCPELLSSPSLSSLTNLESVASGEGCGWGQFVDSDGIAKNDQDQQQVTGYAFESVRQGSMRSGSFFEDEK